MGDRARPRTRVTVPSAADDRGERARVERAPRSSRLSAPSRLPGPPDPGSPDLGHVWGSRAPLPPASRHLGALRRPPWTAPNRCSSSYSPALPGARPPATSATPATARRSSSTPRGEARTAAISGPGSGATGCSDPAWQPPPLAEAPPRRPGPLMIGGGSLKPRPSASGSIQNLLGAGTFLRPRLFVKAQLCVGFLLWSPAEGLPQVQGQKVSELEGSLQHPNHILSFAAGVTEAQRGD